MKYRNTFIDEIISKLSNEPAGPIMLVPLDEEDNFIHRLGSMLEYELVEGLHDSSINIKVVQVAWKRGMKKQTYIIGLYSSSPSHSSAYKVPRIKGAGATEVSSYLDDGWSPLFVITGPDGFRQGRRCKEYSGFSLDGQVLPDDLRMVRDRIYAFMQYQLFTMADESVLKMGTPIIPSQKVRGHISRLNPVTQGVLQSLTFNSDYETGATYFVKTIAVDAMRQLELVDYYVTCKHISVDGVDYYFGFGTSDLEIIRPFYRPSSVKDSQEFEFFLDNCDVVYVISFTRTSLSGSLLKEVNTLMSSIGSSHNNSAKIRIYTVNGETLTPPMDLFRLILYNFFKTNNKQHGKHN